MGIDPKAMASEPVLVEQQKQHLCIGGFGSTWRGWQSAGCWRSSFSSRGVQKGPKRTLSGAAETLTLSHTTCGRASPAQFSPILPSVRCLSTLPEQIYPQLLKRGYLLVNHFRVTKAQNEPRSPIDGTPAILFFGRETKVPSSALALCTLQLERQAKPPLKR